MCKKKLIKIIFHLIKSLRRQASTQCFADSRQIRHWLIRHWFSDKISMFLGSSRHADSNLSSIKVKLKCEFQNVMFYLYCLKCFCENEMLRVRKARDTSNHQIYFHVWQIL